MIISRQYQMMHFTAERREHFLPISDVALRYGRGDFMVLLGIGKGA